MAEETQGERRQGYAGRRLADDLRNAIEGHDRDRYAHQRRWEERTLLDSGASAVIADHFRELEDRVVRLEKVDNAAVETRVTRLELWQQRIVGAVGMIGVLVAGGAIAILSQHFR